MSAGCRADFGRISVATAQVPTDSRHRARRLDSRAREPGGPSAFGRNLRTIQADSTGSAKRVPFSRARHVVEAIAAAAVGRPRSAL